MAAARMALPSRSLTVRATPLSSGICLTDGVPVAGLTRARFSIPCEPSQEALNRRAAYTGSNRSRVSRSNQRSACFDGVYVLEHTSLADTHRIRRITQQYT